MFRVNLDGLHDAPMRARQNTDERQGKMRSSAERLFKRFYGINGGITIDDIIAEFLNVLAVKRLYGPRLWDTPGVVALQVGLTKSGRPLLDVIVKHPGDIPKIPKILMAPGPLGRAVKLRARAVGFKLRLPRKKIMNAYFKLDQLLYNLQGFRTAGISLDKQGKSILTAVLLHHNDGQYIPEKIGGFRVRTYYLG
jgi:hypothetical protein